MNENSGYGSDATFTTRLVFRAAVLLIGTPTVTARYTGCFETFAELDGGGSLPWPGAALPVSSVRQWMLAAKLAQALPDIPAEDARELCYACMCAVSGRDSLTEEYGDAHRAAQDQMNPLVPVIVIIVIAALVFLAYRFRTNRLAVICGEPVVIYIMYCFSTSGAVSDPSRC